MGPVLAEGRLMAGDGVAPIGWPAPAEPPLGIDDLCALPPVRPVGNLWRILEGALLLLPSSVCVFVPEILFSVLFELMLFAA